MANEKILQLVTFKIGNEEFGVDILKVQEINKMMNITRIPNAPEYVEGVINLRGKIVPVVDLRKRLNFPQRPYDKNTRIIVVELDGMILGFIVDSVSEVLRIPESTVEPPPAMVSGIESEYVEGIGRIGDRLLILLELRKVFLEHEKGKLQEVANT
ncbi:MAG: chemotaxis protein CheW [Deltaproteobacteria bacterium]|nr:chemotaxis protein CheW [Deltaproteobacteria bacterium]